jgi:deoxyhypusine synthase
MDEKLYIPMGVKTETELFPGFGKKQLAQSAIGALGAGAVSALAWALLQNVTITVIGILIGIIGSVMMTTKDQNNLSVVDQVQNMVRFTKSQKVYPYRYGDEWGLH